MTFVYGGGETNIDKKTGIRYGVIHQSSVGDKWFDEAQFEARDDPFVDTEDYDGWGVPWDPPDDDDVMYYKDDDYTATSGSDGDIFIVRSPFYTLCEFCSPCAPGAGYILNEGGVKAYCFGHEWFDSDIAPYKVFKVGSDEPIS